MPKLFVLFASLLAASTASAQAPFQCQATAGTPALIRAEGIAERISDIVLTCTGGVSGSSGSADFYVSMGSTSPDGFAAYNSLGYWTASVNPVVITSRIVAPASYGTEALLVIDDLASAASVGTNVIQGVQVSEFNNQILFHNVPIQPPGNTGTRTFRITNLRVDARDTLDQLVLAFISISGSTSVPLNNTTLLAGIRAPGTNFSLQNAAGAAASNLTFGLSSLNAALATSQTATGGALTNLLKFNEGFAQSFRKRNTATSVATPTALADQGAPGTDYHTESGLYLSSLPGASGLNMAGLATQGSRLVAHFTNVPAGVALYVTTAALPTTGASSAALTAADASGAGTYSAVTPTTTVSVNSTPVGIAPVTLSGGAGTATWELLDADAASLESYTFGVVVAYASPQSGTSTVTGGLGPISTLTAADNTSPVPRFADVSADTASCATTPCLTAVPTAISISYLTAAANPANIPIQVGSTGAALSYTAAVAATVPGWISLGTASGTTPSSVPVIFTPANLPPGIYQATVTLSSPTSAFAPVNIPVVLTVTVGGSGYLPFSCVPSVAVPPTMRAEGISEIIGDVTLTCTGGVPTASGVAVPRYDVTLSLGTAVTSRTYANGWSEALLIVDDPGSPLTGSSNDQLACADSSGTCTLTGTGTGVSYSGATGHPNVFPGRSGGGGNTVTFPSVPIDPPGTAGIANSGAPSGFVRILRITNVRANATAISLTAGSAQLSAAVVISGGAVAVVPSTQTAAFVQASQSFSMRLPDNSAGTSQLIINPGNTTSAQRAGVLRFSELFGTAFRTRTAAAYVDSQTSPTPVAQNIPGEIYNDESGFYAPSLTSPVVDFTTAGLASAGTRVRALIGNIPSGVRVFVSTVPVTFTAGTPAVATTGSIARLVTDEMLAFAPAASTATLDGIPARELTVTSGAASAVWEVLNENPAAIDTLNFVLWVQLSTTTTTASSTITPSYAPAPPAFDPSTIFSASSTLPLPLFAAGAGVQGTFGVRLPTTVSLYGAPNPATMGQAVTLTAVVAGGVSSGKATFYDGTTVLGTSAVSGGQATLVTRLLPSGVRRLHAYYLGDGASYAPSTSAVVTLTVNAIGGGGFHAAVPATTGAAPGQSAVGDFDGDGKADVAVANQGSDNVSVLLGIGDGTFQTAVNYPLGTNSYPRAVAVGDFNGDGKTDLAVATTNGVSILLGNGNGSFQTAVSYTTPSGLGPLVVADFNRDGIADLAVASFGPGQVSVLLGNGDGTFQAPKATLLYNLQGPIAAGDFDGDGIPDLVAITASYSGDSQVSILRGNGDGTFTDTNDFSTPDYASSLTVGDLDGDGNLDVVAASTYGPAANTITVFLGNGNGTFRTGVSYAVGNAPVSLAIGDFNGDGRADLAVANQTDSTVSILPGSGSGTFGSAATIPTGLNPSFVAVSDFNGDGIADLVVPSGYSGNVGVLLGYRSSGLSVVASHTGSFYQGQTGATYTVTVTNASSSAATSGTVTVTETVPTGMTLVSMAGTGWTCPGTAANNCTRGDALSGGASYPAITVTVNVAANASSPLVNSVTASGGGTASASYNDSTAIAVLAAMSFPANHATLGGSVVTFQWTAGTGPTDYWLAVSKVAAGGHEIYYSDEGATLSQVVSGLPTDGSTVYVRLWSNIGAAWPYVDYTYTAPVTATISSPANHATLGGSAVTFQWTAGPGATDYWLAVSDVAVAGQEIYYSEEGTSLSQVVSGLPTDGSTIYVRLWSKVNGAWAFVDSTYTALVTATMTSPVNHATLGGSVVNFQWSACPGATDYWLAVSKVAVAGTEIYYSEEGTKLSQVVSGLPTDGSTVYVRLWSKVNGVWPFVDYTYTAPATAAMTSPANHATLTSSTVTFQWSTGTGATEYWLAVSKVAVAGTEIFYSDEGTNVSQLVTGLPTDGSTVYVRLWSKINGAWPFADYTYTGGAITPVPAAMTSPANHATLAGASVTFQWNAGAGVTQYRLYVSKVAVGGSELYGAIEGSSLSQLVTGLPTDGSTVYVRLGSQISGSWQSADYTYTAAANSTTALAAMTSPANHAALTGSSVTFQWSTGTGATEYWLAVSKVAVAGQDIFYSDEGTNLSQLVTGLPVDGSTVYVRLWSKINGAWPFVDYTYTAASPILVPAAMTSPANHATLPGSTVTFQWSAGTAATDYWLAISKVGVGGHELYYSDEGTNLSQVVTGLPTDGSTVYVRLSSDINGTWPFVDYTYTAQATATMASPVNHATLTSSTVTFQWSTGTGATEYWLAVSKVAVAGQDIFYSDEGTNLSQVVTGLPTDGSTVYVRLWSKINGAWPFVDYTYTAATAAPATATMTSPANHATLTGPNVTFQWSTGTGATEYWLAVSKVGVAGQELYYSDEGTNLSQAVTGLPIDGSTVYVRLWSKINGAWPFVDYTYTAATLTPVPAAMTSPANHATLTGTSATFQWNAGTGVTQYRLYVSKVGVGGSELYGAVEGTSLSQLVTGLPTDGSTVYVRLGSMINGSWQSADYTYTAATIAPATAVMTSPANHATLTGSTVTFQWSTGTGVTDYWLAASKVGVGAHELYYSDEGTSLSQMVIGLPIDGSTVYVRLWSEINGAWPYADYTYTAGTLTPASATMSSPANTATLAGSSVNFQWTTGTGAVEYWLAVSKVGVGGQELYYSDEGTNLSQVVSGLPTNGSTVYVRLWSKINGAWPYFDYTYTASH